MALKYSTCLRNKLQGMVPAVQGASIGPNTGIAAVSGTPDNFTVASGFSAAYFKVGDTIMVSGFLAAANNGIFTISSVTDAKIEVTETSITGEVAGPNVKIQCISGGSLKDIFKDGVLKIYNGTQPTGPDSALGGATELVVISAASATFAFNVPTNGLRFGTSALGVLSKTGVWSGVNAYAGTATWFRMYANATDAGAADSGYAYPRIDGAVGTSGKELNMSSVVLVAAATTTIDTFAITLPEYT